MKTKLTSDLGDAYIKKIRKKSFSLEKTILAHETNYKEEKKRRTKLWNQITDDSKLTEKEKESLETKLKQSREITTQILPALIISYNKLADLKRVEATALEGRAAWIDLQNPMEVDF